MRPVINAAAAEWRLGLEPGHALIDALDGDIGCNRMIEGRRNMSQHAKRATGRMVCGRCCVGGDTLMPARADHDTRKRVGCRRSSGPHHRNRCKKLHQNRDHDDGNQTSQPLAHCFPHRMA